MFAAMLLRTVHCVDGGDGGMQAVRSAPGSRQVALALRRVMPPRIWRRAFHEAYRADEGIDDAGVVAHAGNRTQALVQVVGILACQLPRLLDAAVAEITAHRRAAGVEVGPAPGPARARADVGDVVQAPGLARVACLGHLQSSTHWPPE